MRAGLLLGAIGTVIVVIVARLVWDEHPQSQIGEDGLPTMLGLVWIDRFLGEPRP